MNSSVVSSLLSATTSIISKELSDENIVSVPPIGTLEVKRRMERVSVNPVSGKRYLVPPKQVVSFKPITSLKDKIREEDE